MLRGHDPRCHKAPLNDRVLNSSDDNIDALRTNASPRNRIGLPSCGNIRGFERPLEALCVCALKRDVLDPETRLLINGQPVCGPKLCWWLQMDIRQDLLLLA